MTLTKADMIERFLNGGESGSSSRMDICVVDGYRCIVGYNWAVYAVDLGDEIALFGDGYASDGTDVGWAGYGPGTTTGHLQDIKGALEAHGRPYTVVDSQLQDTGGWPRGGSARPALDGLDAPLAAFVSENEADPREGTGRRHNPSA